MAIVNFPSSPSLNQTYTENGRTWRYNGTGWVVVAGSLSILDADVNASAGIAHSKLASILAGRVLMGNASDVPTATAISGDITLSSSGVTAIGSGVIVNADINASAAIAGSKIASNPTFTGEVLASSHRAGTGAIFSKLDPQSLEIGAGSTTGGSFIDLKNDSTYTDYGLRIIRASGANAQSTVAHRGTGPLAIDSQDAGSIQLKTWSVTRLNINSTGGVGLHDKLDGLQGTMAARGYVGRDGYNGGTWSNVWNIHWTGTPQLYIDNTNVGTFAFTSDYRIKQNVIDAPISGISTINALRPVEYEHQDSPDFPGMFQPDGVRRLGFIAHEAQQVHPSLAEGEKDDPSRVQNLRVDAILAATVKALQEAVERIEALEAQVAALTP